MPWHTHCVTYSETPSEILGQPMDSHTALRLGIHLPRWARSILRTSSASVMRTMLQLKEEKKCVFEQQGLLKPSFQPVVVAVYVPGSMSANHNMPT